MEFEVYPTENEKKIRKGLEKIFPSIKWEKKGNKVIGWVDDMRNFLVKLARRRIRKTFREILLRNRKDDESFFELNKQAACLGKVNLVEEEYPLGNIKVKVEGVDELLDLL